MALERRTARGVAARRGADSLARRAGRRLPRRTYLLFCEGKRTEPAYFEALRRHLRNAAIEIRRQSGTPSTLVRHAARADLDGVDEVWCIFDVEAPNPHGDLREAFQLAKGHPRIDLAVSNPCFELWLLLHFQEWTRYITSAEARTELVKWLPHYDKDLNTRNREVAKLYDKIDAAVSRAAVLAPDDSGDVVAQRNPSSSVWQLIERLMQTPASG